MDKVPIEIVNYSCYVLAQLEIYEIVEGGNIISMHVRIHDYF